MYSINEISASKLGQEMTQNPDRYRLIDIRTPAETSQGIIPGAELIPMHLIPMHMNHWHKEKRTIVLYCRSGARSAQLCAYLTVQNDAIDVVNLRGGVIDWAREGQALGRPDEILTGG